MDEIFVGRQPIYNRKLEVVGYELLYRSSLHNQAQFLDGDQATGEVILNAFLELGLENISGRYPAFINLSRSFLVGDKPLPFSHKRVVLEVLEDIEPDAAVIEALRRLARNGYIIALDDFVYRPELEPLAELAHIIKVDVLGVDPDALTERVAQLKRHKVRLLAEKVESHDEFERCKQLGFDYFQGYFFCKPNIVRGRSRPVNRLVLMNLLAELQRPETDINKLEKLVAQDAALTYRLLRYVNSPCVAIRRKVESLRRALVIIGANTIKNWITLILFTRIDDKPRELVVTALVRARMCELLGAAYRHEGLDRFFTVGLLSAMDALMDQPMEEVLNELPLVEEVKAALRTRDGHLGHVLEQVLLYEWGAWDKLCQSLDSLTYRQAYLDAVRWAGDSLATVMGSGGPSLDTARTA
ncbi:EAL and HDOD domain-containing protein [Sulfurivermis fontis]|uniref:EAL and HDOD domain-containing protein n=1 Tax=Sulfurivermis fontis TaxID=1972068 RepID=UPI000FD7DB65|nr:HDOD domain-containing protein [Sulfurivermis fontis]